MPPLHGYVLLSDKFNPQIVLEELGQQRRLPWRSRDSSELQAAGGEPMACSFTGSTLWPVPGSAQSVALPRHQSRSHPVL